MDLADPRAAALTRERCYDTLLALGADCLRGGVSIVLVAPFGEERHPAGWARVQAWLSAWADPRLVWLALSGGDRAGELSLAARTGLVDQDTGRGRADALELSGVTPDLVPDSTPAGTPLGKLTHPDLPAAAAGAVLSVAGHDHAVAALAVDTVEAQALFNSSGAADVLALAVPSGLAHHRTGRDRRGDRTDRRTASALRRRGWLDPEVSLTTDRRRLSDYVHDLRRAATPEPKGPS